MKGTRKPSWSKLAQATGNGPVGLAANAAHSASALSATLSEQFAPPPGLALAGRFEASAHWPGEMPSGVRSPPCGARAAA
jgi:hypothetical protein